MWLDATFHKVREGGRVISVAMVKAVGCSTEGFRQVLGFDVGLAEDHAFWKAFLRSLVRRGLKGVKLVISDAHEGLKAAIAQVLQEAAWQRCRVHFTRNLLAVVPKAFQEAVAAFVRTIFAQPDHGSAMAQLGRVVEGLRPRFGQAAVMLEEAAEDLLAHLHFPEDHRRRLHSTNPLERLHKEVKRRSSLVGIFPDRESLSRLVGMVLVEQDDEWSVADRRYLGLESMARIGADQGGETPRELVAAIA